MSHDECPFDWSNGVNDKLEGGRLLGATEHRFAYGFFAEDGSFIKAFIAGVTHGEDILTLLTTHPDELALLLVEVYDQMGEVDGYNVYANEGKAAGMSVSNHAHLHVVRRNKGERASGMGLDKLVRKFNELSLAYDKWAWSGGT